MFPLRHSTVHAVRFLLAVRHLSVKGPSSEGPLVDLAVDDEGIALMTMHRPPVNGLNLDLLQEMSKSLDEVEKNGCKGLILTSGCPKVFSAGLDIAEIYKPDLKRAEIFWTSFQDVWLKLFGSRYPTAAAINGHALAGACVLVLSTEYRAMVSGEGTIGLIEAALGGVASDWVIDIMKHTISHRQTEIALTTAKPFTVDEALKVGLIDAAVSDQADAVEKCRNFIRSFDGIPPFTRAVLKQRLREGTLKKLQQNRRQDTENFINILKDHMTQQAIGMYAQRQKKHTPL